MNTNKWKQLNKEVDKTIESMEDETKDQIINMLIIDLEEAREHLTIKDYALMIGTFMDDLEIEALIKELKNISINI